MGMDPDKISEVFAHSGPCLLYTSHIHYQESYQMVVTPKEMDEEVKHLTEVISTAINQVLHPRYSQM